MTSPARVRRGGSAMTPLPRRSGGRWKRHRRTRPLVVAQYGAGERTCAVDDPPHLACLGLQPHRSETFKLSSDPFFVEKVRDIIGLYLNPPERALVLCVDEKSQIQALDRTQPLLPMRPGQAERRSHDYQRHGTLSLFAALDIATGQVIGRCFARHRARQFRAFLNTVEARVPDDLDVHIVMDNLATHKT